VTVVVAATEPASGAVAVTGLVAVSGAVVVMAAFAATVGAAAAFVGAAVTLADGGIGVGALVAGPPGTPGRFTPQATSTAAAVTKATIKAALDIQVCFILLSSFPLVDWLL
jgi:hypothetical protein